MSEAGDALQLDGGGVHGPQELVELPIRFLSVVAAERSWRPRSG